MSFTSFRFVCFFIVVFLFNWGIASVYKAKSKSFINTYKTLLLFESVGFIVISDFRTIGSVLFLLIISIICTHSIEKYNENQRLKNVVLVIALVLTIGQLCYFKYIGMYAPIGISFFTFSSIAYMVDVYKGKCVGYSNSMDLMLYLSFFPKFVSGPIMRPEQFQKRLKQSEKNFNLQNIQEGLQVVVIGMFKKMVLADHLAVFVNDVYRSPVSFAATTCIWAVISYSLQIYFDFSGYSDMAIGLAKMMGIQVDKNFNLPYISKNVTEFWKRWHISLSSWLQEYVYISLGGNRKGKVRTQLNLILTMLIGGIWHGSTWNFVIWGLLHGIALVIQKKYTKLRKRVVNEKNMLRTMLSVTTTFIFVSIAWVFFRAENMKAAFDLLGQIVSVKSGINQIYSWTWLAIVALMLEILLAKWRQRSVAEKYVDVYYPIVNLASVKGLVAFFTLVGLTIILAYVGDTAFIYGAF